MKASEGFNPGESNSIAGVIDKWCSGAFCPSGPPELISKELSKKLGSFLFKAYICLKN